MPSGADVTQAILLVGVLVLAAVAIDAGSDRARIPSLIGLILLGTGVRFLDEQAGLLATSSWTTLEFLGRAGIVVLLFRIGFESDIGGLTGQLGGASLAWISNVTLAGAAGFLVVYVALDMGLAASLIAATAFTATSVGIPVATWRRHGRLDSREGQRFLDIAELDDISAIAVMAVLFAVLPSLQSGTLEPGTLVTTVGWFALTLGLFAGGLYLFARHAEAKLAAVLHRLDSPAAPMLALLGIGFVVAAIADLAGFSAAIGAFLAGLAFSRDPDRERIDRAMGPVHDLMTPFFFILIGASIPIGEAAGGIGIGLLLAAVAAATKLLGAGLPSLLDLAPPVAVAIGVSMIPRAEVTMVVMQHARGLGEWAVPGELFSAMVVVVMLTSFIAPLLLDRWLLPRLQTSPAQSGDHARTRPEGRT